MIPVGIMQMPVHQVADMVPVGHRFMPAPRTVHVVIAMSVALMTPRAPRRVLLIHGDHVLIHMIPVRVMQVPVMQIVHMTLMPDRRMPAVRSVLMTMVFMLCAIAHLFLLLETPHSSE